MQRRERLKAVKVNKVAKRKATLKRSATVCFCAAFALVIITYVMTLPEVERSLQDMYAWFERIENYIENEKELLEKEYYEI